MGIDVEMQELLAEASGTPQPSRSLIPYLTTAAALCEEDIPPREFLLSCWMPMDSFGMVFAPRGIGKTWFAMALAVAVAEGRKHFLGWSIHKKSGVLYIDGEMAKVDLRDRFAGLMEEPLDNVHILSSEQLFREARPICLDHKPEQKAVEDALAHLENQGTPVQLIILDNLSTLRRGINENDNSEAQSLIDWLVTLRHAGYTVLVVHHTNKNGQQRGASVIEVPMDYIIKLNKPSSSEGGYTDGACFELEFEKIRAKRPKNDQFTATLRERSDGILDFAYSEADTEAPKYIRVLRFVAENKKVTYKAIATKLGYSLGSITEYMAQLRKEDLIHPGKPYVAAPKGMYELNCWWPNVFEKPDDYEVPLEDDIPF